MQSPHFDVPPPSARRCSNRMHRMARTRYSTPIRSRGLSLCCIVGEVAELDVVIDAVWIMSYF